MVDRQLLCYHMLSSVARDTLVPRIDNEIGISDNTRSRAQIRPDGRIDLID